MADHSSASVREHTPHENQTRTNTIFNALKRRAQAVLNDKSIDPQSRAIIRYALEVNDPWLARLVRRVDAGERIDDTFDFEETPEPNNDVSETNSGDSRGNKISAFVEIICRAGDETENEVRRPAGAHGYNRKVGAPGRTSERGEIRCVYSVRRCESLWYR